MFPILDELRKCRIRYHQGLCAVPQLPDPGISTRPIIQKFAYIGKNSLRQRIKLLEKERSHWNLDEKQKPLGCGERGRASSDFGVFKLGVLRLSGMDLGYGLPRQGEPEEGLEAKLECR